MTNKQIIVKSLYDNSPQQWDNVQRAEEIVFQFIAGLEETTIIELSKGYNPFYDAIMSDGLSELKIQSGPLMTIEYSKLDRTSTGILVSDAEWYWTLNLGWNLGINNSYYPVGKLRKNKTTHLLDRMIKKFECGYEPVKYEMSKLGDGTLNVKLHSKHDFEHNTDGWVADIGVVNGLYDQFGKMVQAYTYDFDNIIRVNRKYWS